jgi:hypothetical protein
MGLPRSGKALRLEQHDADEQEPVPEKPRFRQRPKRSRATMNTSAPTTGPQKLTVPPPIRRRHTMNPIRAHS